MVKKKCWYEEKKIWSEKEFWSEKNLVQKNLGLKKSVGPKKNLVNKKCWVKPSLEKVFFPFFGGGGDSGGVEFSLSFDRAEQNPMARPLIKG